MTNRTVAAGTVLYTDGTDVVRTLDIIAKGTVRATSAYSTFDMPAGSIIGFGEYPGSMYTFSYEAVDEVSLFSYTYESEASLVALFKANPKLLGLLVSNGIRFAWNMQNTIQSTMASARTEYAAVCEARDKYPQLTISVGRTPEDFPKLNSLIPPDMQDTARGWHRDFVEELYSNDARFRKDVFHLPSVGLGIGLTINSYALESRDFLAEIFDYLDALKRISGDFMILYRDLLKRAEAGESAPAEEEHEDVSVHHPLEAIRMYASPAAETMEHFESALARFKKMNDRYGSEDDARRVRRELAVNFYEIYTACFLHAVKDMWTAIPLGVRMFLLFGYADEELAGAENTGKLAAIADAIMPGRNYNVLTIFEWLTKIYKGQVVPSKNEFDEDYPAHLRTLKKQGDINEAQEQKLLVSAVDKLKFEINNMFALANRMTFGRITTFVPVFDKENLTKPIEQSYLNANNIEDVLNKIRSIDYLAFCRQGIQSYPDVGVNTFFTQDEILPYVILLPNAGSRASLWQEIDSKKRSTPARMVISIFHTENLEDTFIRLVGEFRWEMCKTEQGVHWNDITDQSLTSMYCDYLQFYRKNSALSQETKEKLSASLKNNANNFKKVYVEDYFIYIKYESGGALRLNKTARGILFQFCPFGKESRLKVADNPQFAQCLKQHQDQTDAKVKLIENLIVKMQKKGITTPRVLGEQIDLLRR
ncbi:MAG: hypothetical protein IKO80_06745 [Lachnospiraceae bacterium]|nr:hypothetical protein [Lachnospiraceae bacterium]